LEKITKDFYEDFYGHKDISEGALTKVIEKVPAIFTNAMNEALRKKNYREGITASDKFNGLGKSAGTRRQSHGVFFKLCSPPLVKTFTL